MTNPTNTRRYTTEVQQALDALKPAPPPTPPTGQMRYHLAIGDSLHSGVGTPATIATILTGLAAELHTLGDPNAQPEA